LVIHGEQNIRADQGAPVDRVGKDLFNDHMKVQAPPFLSLDGESNFVADPGQSADTSQNR
jgi:hypothetical protein